MRPTRHWRSMGVLVIVALSIAGVAWAATRAEGRTGSHSASNDGGAWLVKRDAGAVGHLNREVLEVSAGVRIGEVGSNLDIDQFDDVIVVHDRSLGRAMLLDGRTNQTRGDIAVPDGVTVSATRDGIVVHRNQPLEVWDLSSDAVALITDVADAEPVLRGSGGLVTVGPDLVAIYDADTASVITFQAGIEVGRHAIGGVPGALSLAGDQVVAAVEDSVVLVGSDRRYDPGVGPYTLQQPAPSRSVVVVDSTDTAFMVDTGGSTESYPLAGATTDPVNHESCAFAIIDQTSSNEGSPTTSSRNNGPALERHCDSGSTTMPLDGAVGELRLRVVNGWVWVNDLDTGGAWITNSEAPLSRVDDWGAVLAEEATDDADATVEDEGGVEEVRLNPDADDVQVIDADQQDDDDENDPPVARDDEGNTRVDRPVVLRVLDNDEDPDGDVLLIESIEILDATGAQVWVTPRRDAVQVTPPAGFTGSISFAYTVTDGRGGSARGLVNVEVTAMDPDANRPPEPTTDVASVRAGSATSLNVLTNDVDPDGDALVLHDVFIGDDQPAQQNGTVVFDPSGQLTFTPDPASTQGRIALGYIVADDFGAAAEGRIVVNVRLAEANSAPDARNDSIITSVGNPARTNVLDNDTDPDNDALIVARQPVLTSGPDGLTNDEVSPLIQMTSDGEFYLAPERPGVYLFDYLASDGQSSDTAQIRVDVSEATVNLPPVAVRDDVSIPMGSTRLVYVLDNDGDPNGDVIDIVEWSGATGLDIEPVPGVGFRVTVGTDAPDRVTFRYAISDGTTEPVASVVVVSVADVAAMNQPPVARPDSIELRAGRSTTIPVLGNDFDPEGGSLSVIGLPPSTPEATYELGADGQSIVITLSPTASSGFRFGYDVTDSDGATAASIVDVRVIAPTEPNRSPTAMPDIARTVEDRAITIDALANDTDADGDVTIIESIATQPPNGTAQVEPTGEILYRPSEGFTGTDRFTYVLVDTEGARSIGSIQVGVTPKATKNRPPSANDDRFVVADEADLDVLANDSDPDGDTLTLTSFTSPSRGSLVQRGPLLRFAPPTVTETTEISFVYEISDGRGNNDNGTVTVVIEPTPEPVPPVAVDDQAGPIRGNRNLRVDVLANDVDVDGANTRPLQLISLDSDAQVINGQLEVRVGTESQQYRYRVTDADGLSDEATLTVLVVENEAPDVRTLSTSTRDNEPLTIDLTAQATDPDDDELFFVCCDNVTGGVANIVASGAGVLRVEFTPSPDFTGVATFSYQVDDQAGHLVSGPVSIMVEPPANRPPTAGAGTVEIEAGTAIPFDLGSLVEDPDDNPLSFAVDGSALVERTNAGVVTLRAPVDAAGTTESIAYRVTDPGGLSASSTLAVEVTTVQAPRHEPLPTRQRPTRAHRSTSA